MHSESPDLLKLWLNHDLQGKRTRQNVDGSKVMKVFLDPKGEFETD